MKLTINLSLPDEGSAKAIHSALSPDDDGYVTVVMNGCTVTIKIEAPSAGGLRSAADDVMACVKAAEESLGIVSRSSSDLDSNTFLE